MPSIDDLGVCFTQYVLRGMVVVLIAVCTPFLVLLLPFALIGWAASRIPPVGRMFNDVEKGLQR